MSNRRAFSLDGVRADGWFEKLGDGAPHFSQLCEAIGERTVAFAVISGIRITSVTIDRQTREQSLIEFALGDDEDETHSMPLGELRRRLGASLVGDESFPETLSDKPSADELQAFIGFRYLLLAPIFGVSLRELRYGDGEAAVLVDLGGAVDEIPLGELRTLIRERVQAEAQGPKTQSPFAIDLNAIPEAERAVERGDFQMAIDRLGSWPGPLSMLLRTAEGQQLASDVKATLARALGLLGTAYAETGNHEWAEEVMRLGIQWGQESGGRASADLFLRLGATNVARARYGQAIGLLRRALSLGAAERDALPYLARCFFARGHFLPAAVCAEQARALGVDEEDLNELLSDSIAKLGEPWVAFRKLVPEPACDRVTRPPPPES